MGKSTMKVKLTVVFMVNILAISFFFPSKIYSQKKTNNPLLLKSAASDFSENPKLLKRILSSPHGYFRFINIKFSQEICHRFNSKLAGAPTVNLHGDAHLEQYAVTDLGRGLTDFDDSSMGPGILDWMRLGVSLRLACQANGWLNQADSLFGIFFKGYRTALDNPKIENDEPIVVKRMKSKFKINREKYFQWVNSIMEPMPQTEKDSLMLAVQPYVETQLAEHPELKADYFKVIDSGYLKLGIGSALDLKFVVRIQGKTNNPMDDVVLEFKQVRDITGISCIQTGQKMDPFRILLGESRIAYQPFQHLGYFKYKRLIFWVHSWVDNYDEVKINKTFKTPAELAEVAYDIGIQLGKGHVKHIAAPLDLQLRRQQLHIIKDHEQHLRNACQELTKITIAAWELFRERVNEGPAGK